jgi:hypothetical protein
MLKKNGDDGIAASESGGKSAKHDTRYHEGPEQQGAALK